MRRVFLLTLLFVVLAGGGLYWNSHKSKPVQHATNTPPATTPKPIDTQTGFDKKKYPLDQATSLWWIVNKTRPLPDGYVPPNLAVPNVTLRLTSSTEQMHIAADVAPHIEQLFSAANSAGYKLMLDSGYRSESYQKQLYASYVAKDGQVAADRYSARPGTSEHQTGRAFDVGRSDSKCSLDICFGKTDEGLWLAAHAHEYGFVIRYLDGKESITGYQYEPWHLRYVGIELATEVHKTGLTLEEFFGLPAAPDYPKI
jgi:LAS superfamily LD-carboxypeptidase LdcB